MSLPASYFEGMYDRTEDPWGFRTRWYETRKRALVLACLQSERYAIAFEPGCSIGMLTAGLAERVDRLLAMDVSSRALAVAAAGAPPAVQFRQGQVPRDWPGGDFDLVVVSEVAYYLTEAECRALAGCAAASAGELVVVHWRHPVADYPLAGDQVQAIFAQVAERSGLKQMLSHVEPDFSIGSWCRDGRSVATRGGLVSP